MSNKLLAMRAGLWSSVDIGFRFTIQFIVSIILARILVPADFGIYALTIFFVSLSAILVDGGFSAALVQAKEVTREQQTAVFWYNLIIAAIMAIAIMMLAAPVAHLLGHPALERLLYASSAIVPIGALSSVPNAMLQREVRFDLVARAGLASSAVGGLVAIYAASTGAGVWAFIYQSVCTVSINTCLIWVVSSWRPTRRPQLGSARQLAGFGSLIAFSGLLEVAYTHGSNLIIGKLYGVSDLGFYTRGQSLQNMPANILYLIVNRVALPFFSAKKDDDQALIRGARAAQGIVMLINLPLMCALATIPDLIISVLYGPSWLPSAPLLAILAVGGVLLPLSSLNLQLVLAKGRSDLYFRVELIKKAFGILCVIVGSLFGVFGLVIGQLIFAYVAFFVNASLADRLINYGPFAQLRDIGRTLAASFTMVVALLVVRPMLPFDDLLNLILLTLIGMTFFFAAAVLFKVEALTQLVTSLPWKRQL